MTVRFSSATSYSVETAKDGGYEIRVPAATYDVTLTGTDPVYPYVHGQMHVFSGPTTVTAKAGKITTANYRLDSGFR
jgi:hypothetical protein